MVLLAEIVSASFFFNVPRWFFGNDSKALFLRSVTAASARRVLIGSNATASLKMV